MISGSGHPLAYPVLTTFGALAICLAWAPFADLEQASMLAAVAVIVLGYTAFRLAVAFGKLPVRGLAAGTVECRRVRQQHRLLSRSWLELEADGRKRWLPVYFDPALVTLSVSTPRMGNGAIRIDELRLYPTGPLRDSEPTGKLIDNPARPNPDGAAHAARSARFVHRLVLDAQFAVAAPFAALLWVYVAGGGFPAFVGAVTVAAGVATWFAAIRGSDPS
ncbi:hypothetical protein [Nocardia mexicana]|uniref:Uncharacterized protein n=1 Tax=Nocardia mexicana TaxID=279262 RepID=A0A370H2W9_9NOCA|nr:hypothetical protein [Nocardia mexicana]RDI48423.1 hypothetical protein DFR68_108256 [Nocardia mexicana]